MIPGEFMLKKDKIEINEGRPRLEVTVVNTGDRPVQVGSHFHFFEVNKYLNFDREKTLGYRLNIPSGTAVRFEPGEEKNVRLVAYSGKKRIDGFNGLVRGLDLQTDKAQIIKNLEEFLSSKK